MAGFNRNRISFKSEKIKRINKNVHEINLPEHACLVELQTLMMLRLSKTETCVFAFLFAARVPVKSVRP